MKALIFGINGQDGYYLSKLLNKKGCQVVGVSRSKGDWLTGDVGCFETVKKVISREKPDFIFHFAADSTTKHEALFANHNAISTGTLNILESTKLFSPHTKVFLSGSALQFKNDGSPIDEQTPFEAKSPYAVARIQSVYVARYYRETFGLNVYVGFFFNHDSPLRTERHVNQKIISAAKRIAQGSQERIAIGNINIKKEFNFAGDAVNAVWMLVNQSEIFEAVIGSGETHSLQEWVEYCFSRINKDWKDYVIVNNDFISEYDILQSNPQLIKSLGWQPETSFTQLADLMMEEI